MFGRTVARVVTSLALLAASVSWIGWIYLRTAADPTRSDRIAHAILDDPRARHEVAVDIANGIASATNKALTSHGAPAVVDGGDPALQSAVEASLADPRITANLIDAISAEHERALGETPAHPAAIDTGLLIGAVRAHLLAVEPAVAHAIPAVNAGAIRLPAARIPYARQTRTLANRWVRLLAAGAVAGLLLAILIGDRAGVLRRVGFWAIGAGLTWAVVPPLVAWGGDHWVRGQAAVIRAVLRGATGAVTATASLLALAGAAAVAVSYAAPHVLGALRPADGALARRPVTQGAGGGPGGGRRAWARPVATAGPARGGSGPDRLAPRTDTWTPHEQQAQDIPLVYDRHGDLDARPARRPGVSRADLGLAPQDPRAPAPDRAPAPPATPAP